MRMVSLENKQVATRKLSGFIPPHWLEQYKSLAQPSGGIQINLDRHYIREIESIFNLETTAGNNKWPQQITPAQMDTRFAIVALWSVIPGMVALSTMDTDLYESIGGLDISRRIYPLAFNNLLLDYSGNQAWITNDPIQQQFRDTASLPTSLTIQKSNAPSIEEIQNYIVHTFCLSGIADLANLCGVSRQALYDWRKSTARPEKDKIIRLYSLWDTARNWTSLGFPAPAAQLHQNILRNRSLHDYLSETQLDTDAISFIGHRFFVAGPR